MISLKSAPRWLAISNAFVSAVFVLPVLMLYYGQKGISTGDFFLIQGLSWICVFLTEIPTGYIGDLFSRKRTLIIGTFFWILGNIILIYCSGFFLILAAELIFGIAIAFISGTVEAYLYDLLKKRHKEQNYHKKFSKMETIENVGLMIATLTGAFFYQYFSPDTPVWLSVVCASIGLGILFLLPDVPESKRIVAKDKSKWQDILDISKYAIKHPEIKWLMIFPGVYSVLTALFMWGSQSVMIDRNIPIFIFSFVVGLNSFSRMAWSAVSGKLLEKFHLSGVIKILCGIIILAALGACLSLYIWHVVVYVCLILMVLGSSSIVLSRIATSTLVNHRIKSDERATVLSVKSMVERAFQGLGLICLKPLFDGIGVGPTFMVSALLLIPILICARHLYKMKLKTMKEI